MYRHEHCNQHNTLVKNLRHNTVIAIIILRWRSGGENSSDLHQSQNWPWRRLGAVAPICPLGDDANV